MKRRPRIDAVLERPEVRTLIEEFKHHFAEASAHHGLGALEAHHAAALEARERLIRIIDAVRAERGNENLGYRPVYHYVANVAFHELTEPISTPRQRAEVELTVHFAPGRPPNRHTEGRERVIEDLRRQPELADWQVADRAIRYGAWKPGEADEPGERRRRIRRLRSDAAK